MTLLERAVENRTCQIVAGVLGLIIFCVSMGFLAASRAPIERLSSRIEAKAQVNLPIVHTIKHMGGNGAVVAAAANDKRARR